MGIGPFWFELQGGLKLFNSLLGITLVSQSERQIVMCKRVVRCEFQRPVVCGNGLVPGFLAGKFDALLAVSFGRLRKRGRRDEGAEKQEDGRSTLANRNDESAAEAFINTV